jgi:ArsR family transcriptional regulator
VTVTNNIYRILSDPTRRNILHILSEGERTQSEIVERFNISQPAINKQLRIIKEEGFIQERRTGRYRLYSLDSTAFASAYQAMVDEIGSMLDKTLVDLKRYVENEEEEND